MQLKHIEYMDTLYMQIYKYICTIHFMFFIMIIECQRVLSNVEFSVVDSTYRSI